MTSPALAAPAEVEGRLALSLGAALTSRLDALAGEVGVSLGDVLAGAWALVLHAYTGQDEVTLQLLPGGRRAKVRPTGSKPVARLLKEVKRSLGSTEGALLPSFAYEEHLVLALPPGGRVGRSGLRVRPRALRGDRRPVDEDRLPADPGAGGGAPPPHHRHRRTC